MERTSELHSEGMVAELDVAEFSRAFRSRNEDILSAEEQAVVDASKVLVAGCGTVGGSAVEPLVRLGVNDLVLADPDVYDVTNLNRQACLLADVGRPKPAVLAERAAAINPFVKASVRCEGVTPENVEAAFEGVTFVCEGVDASMDLWAKYLVHHHAALRRIPVVSGVDFGGKPTLYVFDYRRDPRPFYGRGSEADHRDGNTIEAIRWIGTFTIPADFAPIIVDRLRTGAPWPQTVYTGWGIGALMTRALVDLGLHRDVPRVLAIDFHQLSRSRAGRVRERLRQPRALLRARREANRVQREGEEIVPSPERTDAVVDAVPARLLPLAEAIRLAPSFGNLQPWRLEVEDGSTVRLRAAAEARLPLLDPDGALLAQGLGCAIEAAASVAELAVEMAPEPQPAEPDALVATLRLERYRADYSARAGLLSIRHSNRRAYAPEALPPELLAELTDAAAAGGVPVLAFDSSEELSALAAIAARSQRARLGARSAREDVGAVFRTPGAGPRTWSARGRARSSTARSRRLVERSGAALVIGWGRRPSERIAAGRALMSAWLAASRAGLAAHPVAAWEPDPSELAAAPGAVPLPAEGFTLLRLGRARRCPPGPRAPLEQIVRA